MTRRSLVRLGVAGALVAILGAWTPAAALSVPDGRLLALESVNRPVLRELADLKARESERLGKIEDRLDWRMTRLEQSFAGAAERSRIETNDALQRLGSALDGQIAAAAESERLLLLAIAGGYLWSALLWIELRRTTRALRGASVKKRFQAAYVRPVAAPDDETPHPGNGRVLQSELAPPA